MSATATSVSDRAPLVGAWEAVLEHAALKVCTYLASSNTPFDTATPLAKSMLCLLDHGTLRDILVERNVSGLCGNLGCPRLPRGVTSFRQRRAEARGLQVDGHDDDDEEQETVDDSAAHPRSRVLTDAEMAYMESGPRHRSGARRRIISSNPNLCSCSDLDDDGADDVGHSTNVDGDVDDDGAHNDMVREDASAAAVVADHADPEELVYDEDYFTLESFRLARRQQQQLARLRRRAELAREPPRATAESEAGGTRPRRGRRGHAELWERFCSLECEDHYLHVLRPATHHFRTYDHAAMRQAVSHLFPTLRPDVLHRLADADVASGAAAAPLMTAAVKEANDIAAVSNPAVMAPVQTGVDYEAAAAPAAPSSAPSSAAVVSDVLRQMQILGKVWGAEVAPSAMAPTHTCAADSKTEAPACAVTAPTPAPARGDRDGQDDEDADDALQVDSMTTGAAAGATLTGPLLVLDFLTSAAGETTHYLFFYYYCLNRSFLQQKMKSLSSPSASSGSSSMLAVLVLPVLAALEQRALSLLRHADSREATWCRLLEVRASEALRVNPLQQQPRRELFAGRYLSGETAAAVAQLLLVDHRILFDAAWHAVWMKSVSAEVITAAGGPAAAGLTLADAHAALTLAHSLQHRFAVPSALLQPVGSAREPLTLALALVLSALCVSSSARLWREMEMSDADGALGEVMEAVGVTSEDMSAVLTALVLGDANNSDEQKQEQA